MKILCSHPGRYGDLLWALPTVRALHASYGEQPVDLLLPPRYSTESFRSLLALQRYVGEVLVASDWEIQESAPITPRLPPTVPSGYDHVVHLGYEGWPSLPLPWEICGIAEKQIALQRAFDLETPWIFAPAQGHARLTVGFTEEHFELKVGLVALLKRRYRPQLTNLSTGPRWKQEVHHRHVTWNYAVRYLACSPVFVGCCSALHVLACAIGTPVVVVEPNPARHHDVFYPFGKTGRVQLLTGNDGLPTVDARHLCEAIEAQLEVPV